LGSPKCVYKDLVIRKAFANERVWIADFNDDFILWRKRDLFLREGVNAPIFGENDQVLGTELPVFSL